MKLSILLLTLAVAASASAAPAKSSKKKTDSAATTSKKAEPAATPVSTPSNDVAAADTTVKETPKAEARTGAIVRGPNVVKPRVETRPISGEVFVAPSLASLGEKWADSMTDDQIGSEADRKTWNPAFAFGATQPIGALSVELEGSGTQFSAPVPGGKTEGFVGHGAGRIGYERGAFGGEAGVLVRIANIATPDRESNGTPQVFPSVELRRTSATGTVAFVAAWDNPMLPYGNEGWLRAGARHDWGRLSGELAVGIDPFFSEEDATGPVIDSRLDVAVGHGMHVGVAMRAADEPMAAFVVRRSWR